MSSEQGASPSTITLSMPEADIAVLTLDMQDKGANILSRSVLVELAAHLETLEAQPNLAGVVFISGKPNMFIAGADLREFVASLNAPKEDVIALSKEGQDLFARFTKLPAVSVVAIDGICVGGGAELAVWCDRRIMSDGPKTEIGFPEVKLGLFPGWGGTARTPRIVGLGNAVELVTGGESIDAQAARAMGLVSDIVPAADLLQAAVRLIRIEQQTGQFGKDRESWAGPISMSETELGFLGATASAVIQGQTKGQYPAPLAALEVMMGGSMMDIQSACEFEATEFAKLFGSEVNRSLLNIFFLTDRNKKDEGVDDTSLSPESVNSAAVIGAGIMGAGIAAANVKRGISVSLTDANKGALAKGVSNVLTEVSFNKATRQADVDLAVKMAPLINGTVSDAEVAACDVVIEAVVENADVKKSIYKRLEPLLGDNTILASNTSTIPITGLAKDLAHPDRFCGIHFFNPVRKMKLVEVIRGEKTSNQTVITAVAYAKRLGKFPIVVNDGPGFLVNRLLLPYMNEALELLCEGAEIAVIEKVAKAFGMPMGPITLYDVVGLDTAFYAGRVMWEAFPDRISASPVLPALVKAGRLGQKSGAGFFSYQNPKKKGEFDPEIAKFIDPYKKGDREFDKQEIENRLFLPMLLEATRVLQEKIVRDVRDVDLGLIFGIGFPPFKGGLLHWADRVGAKELLERLKTLESLGARTKPTELLLSMAAEGKTFYSN